MNYLKKKRLHSQESIDSNDFHNKFKNENDWIKNYTLNEIKRKLQYQKEQEILDEIFDYLKEEENGTDIEYYTYNNDIEGHFYWRDRNETEHDGWLCAYNNGFTR